MGKEIAAFSPAATLPDHVRTAAPVGNENVTANDMAIPRLKILQQLSPELDDTSSKYVEGAQAGHLLESVSGETFANMFVINLKYERTFSVFRKRKLGGGFFGNFSSEAEATSALEADKDVDDVKNYDVVDTANHILLLLNEKGEPVTPVIMSFSSTALKVSNAWNTMIKKESAEADRFASVWAMSTVREKNSRGSWFAPKVEFAGWANEALLDGAREFYHRIAAAPAKVAGE